MRIVVTTPTGHVGSRVLRLLVQAGVRPVALLRDPARLPPDLSGRVETAPADQTDRDAVLRATAGADRLYWVNPPAPFGSDPLARHAACARVVADAVRENGVGGVVFQSSGGAEKRHGAGDIDGLGATEEALDATGAPVLHLRCGYFMTNLLASAEEIAAGTLSTPWPLGHPLPWVDPRDIGDVAAARLLGPAWGGRLVQGVHGPADLTFSGVADVLAAALAPGAGRARARRRVPRDPVGHRHDTGRGRRDRGHGGGPDRRVRAGTTPRRHHDDPDDAALVGGRAPAPGRLSAFSSAERCETAESTTVSQRSTRLSPAACAGSRPRPRRRGRRGRDSPPVPRPAARADP